VNADDLAAALRAYLGPIDPWHDADDHHVAEPKETWYIDINHTEKDEELHNLAQEIIRAWEESLP
jgi:hypothetical protein